MSYQIIPYQNRYSIPNTRNGAGISVTVVTFGSRISANGVIPAIYATIFVLVPDRGGGGYSIDAHIVEYETIPDDLLELYLQCINEKLVLQNELETLQVQLEDCLATSGGCGGIIPKISSAGCEMLFCYENKAQSSTLSYIPELPEAHENFLLTESRSEVIQTSGTTQEIQFEFDSPITMNFIHVDRHNISANGLINVEFWDESSTQIPNSAIIDYPAQATASPDEFAYYVPDNVSIFFDWQPGEYFTTIIIETPVVDVKTLKILITDGTNPTGWLEICRIFTGFAIQPRYNFSWGISMDWQNGDKFIRTTGGTLKTHRTGNAYRVINLTVEMLGFDERRWWAAMKREIRGNLCFLNCYPGSGGFLERDHCGLFKIVEISALVNDAKNNFSLDSLKFEET